MSAADPEQLGQLYKAAGFDLLANNTGAIRKAETAARNYEELPRQDYSLYSMYAPTDVVRTENCRIPPPMDAVTALIPARIRLVRQ